MVGCPMKAPMIAIPSFVPSRSVPPCTFVASIEVDRTFPGGALDVTDGLVSIGQQAWMNGLAVSVLH
jgi:hypothetical protein